MLDAFPATRQKEETARRHQPGVSIKRAVSVVRRGQDELRQSAWSREIRRPLIILAETVDNFVGPPSPSKCTGPYILAESATICSRTHSGGHCHQEVPEQMRRPLYTS